MQVESQPAVCLVTGGSRGIGAAIVNALAAEGMPVALNYHRSELAARNLAERLQEQGNRVLAVKADISIAAEVEAMFSQIEENLGSVDWLVNNAGISLRGLLQDISEDQWDELMGVNLKGAFLCMRRALPGMIRRRSGSIVNIASIWGQQGAAFESVYSASKGGLIALTRSLAAEVGPSGIRVNALAPGPIATDMLTGEMTLDELAELSDEMPLGRLGRPEDVAAACVFLLSPKAAYINGQVISVDGGWKL
ncbi:MAG: SDR family oxidoreductase [Syntrophomonadaceae bacterium]|nr:SDR family oxidoreductase [Syntrophomonadaceae bacterium]